MSPSAGRGGVLVRFAGAGPCADAVARIGASEGRFRSSSKVRAVRPFALIGWPSPSAGRGGVLVCFAGVGPCAGAVARIGASEGRFRSSSMGWPSVRAFGSAGRPGSRLGVIFHFPIFSTPYGVHKKIRKNENDDRPALPVAFSAGVSYNVGSFGRGR